MVNSKLDTAQDSLDARKDFGANCFATIIVRGVYPECNEGSLTCAFSNSLEHCGSGFGEGHFLRSNNLSSFSTTDKACCEGEIFKADFYAVAGVGAVICA